jgi:histidine triad (HIT) family protein
MPIAEPSVFTRIIARELPSTILFEDDRLIAIVPLEKLAPVHILVIPKATEFTNVTELAAGDPQLLAEVVLRAQALADEHCGGAYRLVFNTGAAAGQTVFHVHAHILGGSLAEGSLAG